MARILRLAVVLALSLAALLGSGAAANAKPAPPPKVDKAYAQCIAGAAAKALKEIDRQTWKNKAAREAALKALIEKIKAACPNPGTQTDACPNLDGVQASVPTGYVKDASGNCVPDTGGACPESDFSCVPAGTGETYTRHNNGNGDPYGPPFQVAPGASVGLTAVCDQDAANDDFNDRLLSHEVSDPSAVTAERERHDGGDARQTWNDGYSVTFTNNTSTPQGYTVTITCERMR